LCKHEAGLRHQLALFHTYHNFVLPHASWRVPLSALDTVAEPGALKRWPPRTPAMAAGLTDRVWSVREVLMYRVPLWPQRPGIRDLATSRRGHLRARRASVNRRGSQREVVIPQLSTG